MILFFFAFGISDPFRVYSFIKFEVRIQHGLFQNGYLVDLTLYKVCLEGIPPCNMKIETFIEEDTRYKKHCT